MGRSTVGANGKALFYLSNHADNICSVKFCGEDVLLSTCDCGMVTLWDLNNLTSTGNYKVSNYSALYASLFDKDHFFVKTKEGSVKLWDIKRNHCSVKLDANNYTYAKPYCVNGKIVTPVNHSGDIAIFDPRVQAALPRSNTMGRMSSVCSGSNVGNSNTLVIRFSKVKKRGGKIKMLSSRGEQKEGQSILSTELKSCSDIMGIYPVPFWGDSFILACYEPSLFLVYDFRMADQFVSSFIIDVKENVLSYHVSKNKCVVSTSSNSVYSLNFGPNEQVCLAKKAHCPTYSMSDLAIRSDNKLFISITDKCSVNLCNLQKMEVIDCIQTYKFNSFNFLDFHPFSGLFAVAERNKVSIWANQASSFEPPPLSGGQTEVVPLG
ncbi:conserved Plasmodium protein, unknown function [Plasmodium vivax]|uniref:Uncharacterized protein n=7 Tax=Plasmodium vivax TaxID=5855 RepID=A5K2Q2_PLAVS|nr:hypothetical protein, conserved [Plasmodium vivax]KMZ79630.1 hypothetical protein PVIIG_00904 [Plasmodium vivax India VII]KMZ85925.1 hypothetical protein PVBG_03390 [Plasmodium vivax Brazil I]KMZ92380.1 hypothetical protein PVMG_03735 [Plasmodium vivax Mauritania I]KMZ98827.1 hypothetical protein PVNG_00621 [Plasmodium vivax North Korean]EDL46702.1 hypothetical protein, conserved [Plasmodium vivax]|eukprot:XP_001616429.1 hypothetical protein [Plasmodium vivax Sal-1]